MVFNPDNWENEITLAIDYTLISGTLTDFPLLIILSSGTGINNYDSTDVFDELGPNSKKIAITSTVSGVETELYTEIETWDYINERASLWTKVPTISSETNTILTLYYDNTQVTNSGYIGYTGEAPAKQVWDNNFIAVYHLSQDPSGGAGCMLDSTANSNNGTPESSMTSGDLVSSATGSGIEFNGTTDYIQIPESMIDNLTGLTLEALVYAEYKAEATTILSDAVHWTDNISLNMLIKPQSSYVGVYGVYESTGVYTRLIDIDLDFNSAEYNYLTGTFTASDYTRFYRNGVEKAQSSTSVSYIKNEDNNLYIGKNSYGAGNVFKGIMDEIRLSNIERSPAWIATNNYNYFNQLITFSALPPPTYYFDGYVYADGLPVSRTIYMYKRDNGSPLSSTTSSGDGHYYIETTYSGAHFLVCLDDAAGIEYKDLIIGAVYPTIA